MDNQSGVHPDLNAPHAQSQSSQSRVTTLPQVLDLTHARPMREEMATLLGYDAVVLDAVAVERMSTPCAQILLATGRACERAGGTFKILHASATFREALADLGLLTEFSGWIV